MLKDRNGTYPHIAVVTCVDCVVESSDTVLFGELSVILSIIRNRMRQEGFNDKAIYPVWLNSFLTIQITSLTERQPRSSCYRSWALNMAGSYTALSIERPLLFSTHNSSTLNAKKQLH